MSVRASGCACIVLASGLSERFGHENKLLADLGGKPVISYALDVSRDVGFKDVFVVSPNEPQLINIIKSYGFTWVENKNPEGGQGTSLSLGATEVLAKEFSVACIMLADMPFVKLNHINDLFVKCKVGEVLFSRCGDVLMPPAIFNHDALQSVAGLQGDRGGKNKVKGDFGTALPLSQLAARDMDTRKDLEEMRELLNSI